MGSRGVAVGGDGVPSPAPLGVAAGQRQPLTPFAYAGVMVREEVDLRPLDAPEPRRSPLAALVKTGYNGPISPEIGRNPGKPDQLREVSAALDKILTMA